MSTPNTQRFLYVLKHTGTRPDFGAKSWSERAKIASRFAEIDFGCNFKDGCCARTRAYLENAPPRASKADRALSKQHHKKACCDHCASSAGYLDGHDGTINPELKEFYAANFHETDGFWRENQGCILPHYARSRTCLTYRCSHAADNTPRAALLPWLRDLRAYVSFHGLSEELQDVR